MPQIKILVVSDLHTGTNKDDEVDTKLTFDDQPNIFGKSLLAYLKDLNADIDILICTGDIGNKGCIQSFKAGWKYLNWLADELNIETILSVPGNHDHQSRPTEDKSPSGFSPKHELQFASPAFPFNDFNKNTHFWAWNWELSVNEYFNCVSLNSSAYHGFGSEFKHGRVALEVCDQIESRLLSSDIKPKPFNLLICHHHPQKMDYIDKTYDGEAMEGADYLLNKLENSDLGPWLIIHGHKHYATICYGNSRTSCPPTILSAGSLSAVLYHTLALQTSNQFYILTIDIDLTNEYGKVVGTFETHEANPLNNWQPSSSENLPAKGGFGSLYTTAQILSYLRNVINPDNSFLEGDELMDFKKKILNMPPYELNSLLRKLADEGFNLTHDSDGEITEIGKCYE